MCYSDNTIDHTINAIMIFDLSQRLNNTRSISVLLNFLSEQK